MNKTLLFKASCALVGLLSVSFALANGDTVAHSGTFKKVQGTVEVRTPDGKTRAVESGAALAAGESVVTGKGSGTALILRDGTELMLGAVSTAALSRFEYDSTTQEGSVLVDLLGGQMRVISGLIAKTKPDNLKVKTSVAIIGVRGTDFIVEAPYAR